ncbi:lysylphosphatidylglycerol synthase domain-containing protein [Azospirillum sp.]|uniref:lysylphosphatidylglycerol synthase domain-containing protein n=1 Tax=Azospirillum sp. TaxID=34012 RepID=UPI003D71ADBA
MGRFLKLFISLAIAAVLFATVDVGMALQALLSADPAFAALASALFFLIHVANAAKLRVLVPERPLGVLLAFTLIAQAYALLLPGQLASEAVKALRLGRSTTDFNRAATSVAFDKVTSIAGVLIVTLVGMATDGARFGPGLAWAAGLGLAALAGGAAVLSLDLTHRVLMRLLEAGRHRAFAAVAEHAGRFLLTWRLYAEQPRLVAASLTYGVLAQFLSVAGTQVMGLGMGIDLPFSAWCVVVGALTVILLAPVTIGGFGLREASIVGLLGGLGVPDKAALALAFAILAFQLVITALGLVVDLAMVRRDGRRG